MELHFIAEADAEVMNPDYLKLSPDNHLSRYKDIRQLFTDVGFPSTFRGDSRNRTEWKNTILRPSGDIAIFYDKRMVPAPFTSAPDEPWPLVEELFAVAWVLDDEFEYHKTFLVEFEGPYSFSYVTGIYSHLGPYAIAGMMAACAIDGYILHQRNYLPGESKTEN